MSYFSKIASVAALFAFVPAIALAGQATQAQSKTDKLLQLANQNLEECVTTPNDPFEPLGRMPGGPDAGKCVDSAKKRYVFRLSNDEVSAYTQPQAGMVYVANFTHQGKYWIAEIPVTQVDRVIFQVQHMDSPVPAAHGQLRVDFKTSVRLFSQDLTTHEESSLQSILLTAEAHGTKGYKYDPVQGFQSKFINVYRIKSLADGVAWTIVKNKKQVEQYLVHLTPQEKTNLLLQYVETSERVGYNAFYHTTKASCGISVLREIDKVVNYEGMHTVNKLENALTFGFIDAHPLAAPLALSARHLTQLPQDRLPDLDKDPSAAAIFEEYESVDPAQLRGAD